jgi:Do/DeqQ family serine protease
LSKKTFASDFNDNKNYKLEENNRPNFIKASEHAIQAVVHIKSKYISNEVYGYYDPFYGKRFFNQPKENFASGSGVIISEDGYIITNRHVINNAEGIEVVLNDKRTYSAKILGEDSNSDLALLKIEENKLPFLEFDNSNHLKVGEWVLAVGNPYNLNSTVTAGIISAKSRKINILNDGGIESFIQTDAAINSGNSGGALVNTKGNLIGINTAIQSKTGSFSGYGFAIPSNMAEKIINDLKVYGEVRRAYIGIHITDINMQVQKELKLNGLEGVLISKVLENSAAELAGIKDLDVILEINGIKVNSTSELHELIIQFNPGDEINCTIQRKEQVETITLSLKS